MLMVVCKHRLHIVWCRELYRRHANTFLDMAKEGVGADLVVFSADKFQKYM